MILETQRARLEPWRPEDASAFHAIASDPEVMKYITGGDPWTMAQSQEFAARQMRSFSERGFCLWKLTLKSTDKVSGFCGIQPLVDTEEIEVGWWLASKNWGMGIATEAAREVLYDAFGRAGLTRVVAVARRENVASLRVMEKIGMVYEHDYIHRGIPVVFYAISIARWKEVSVMRP